MVMSWLAISYIRRLVRTTYGQCLNDIPKEKVIKGFDFVFWGAGRFIFNKNLKDPMSDFGEVTTSISTNGTRADMILIVKPFCNPGGL